MPIDALVLQSDAPNRWEKTLPAFLAKKERRSGSVRTVQSYSRMLRYFFGKLAKPPDAVRPADVLAYAHGVGLSGKEPSAITIGARIALRLVVLQVLHPDGTARTESLDALERLKTPQSTPRGLFADEVERLLAIIPDTPVGLRDRAIILTLLLTGRRRSEVLNLTANDIEPGEPAFHRYRGERGRRDLPHPAHVALVSALSAFDRALGRCPAQGVDLAHVGAPGPSSGTVYVNFRRYLAAAGLPPAGLHLLRHTAAKLRREAGQSIEDVSRFLDHSSLAVTSTFLRRLEGESDLTLGCGGQPGRDRCLSHRSVTFGPAATTSAGGGLAGADLTGSAART